MNKSTVIFLINDKVRAISATYEADSPNGQPAQRTIFKTFDQAIKTGDFVLVPTTTRHNMTVCKVVDVDVEIDLESPTKIDWVIGPIGLQDYEATLVKEREMIAIIDSAEKNRKREELRKSLIADTTQLQSLAIAHITNAGEASASTLTTTS